MVLHVLRGQADSGGKLDFCVARCAEYRRLWSTVMIDKSGGPAKSSFYSCDDYWRRQDQAVAKARKRHRSWTKPQRPGAQTGFAWKRETFALPRAEAQDKAREFFSKYPKAAYWTEVESWRELPGDVIEFTMRRLPSAD